MAEGTGHSGRGRRVLALAGALAGALACGREPAPTPAPVAAAPPSPPAAADPLDALRSRLELPTLARARAYAINVHEEFPEPEEDLFTADGALNPDRAPEAGAVLSTAQLGRFVVAMNGSRGPMGGAYCYYPHHGVVFEDEAGEVLGAVSVCLMCLRHHTAVAGLGQSDADYAAVGALLAELGLPTQFPLPGQPPAPRRWVVHDEVRPAVRGCLGAEPGPPSVTVEVAPDGTVREMVGLEPKARECALDRLNRRGRRGATPGPRLPASRDGGTFVVELRLPE